MNNTDLITILGNISQSLYPLQKLITGGAYLLGFLFFVGGLFKLRKVVHHSSQEKLFPAMLSIFFGAALIYLPSMMDVAANTVFGINNVLTYTPPVKPQTTAQIIGVFIRTAGILWFVRGCVLVVHSGQPGGEDSMGPKGLAFIGAGILSMNFDTTIAMANSLLNNMVTLTLQLKASQGY